MHNLVVVNGRSITYCQACFHDNISVLISMQGLESLRLKENILVFPFLKVLQSSFRIIQMDKFLVALCLTGFINVSTPTFPSFLQNPRVSNCTWFAICINNKSFITLMSHSLPQVSSTVRVTVKNNSDGLQK